jgi:predicted nucleotidyltransferase
MDRVRDLDLPAAHRALLRRAVDRFWDDERVMALVLGGSLAHGVADSYSDVDLYIFARDESFDAVFEERGAVALALGSPLLSFGVDPIPGGSRDYIVTYPGPIKIDLMYYRESEIVPAPKWAGSVVLKDASGFVGNVLAKSRNLAPPTPSSEELLEMDKRFWTLCWYVFGKIMRGELWEALSGIHTIRSDTLLPMLDWTAGSPHEGYRRLETRLDPEMAQCLEDTLGLLETGALYDALQAEISLFRDLCEPLFERFGSTYDTAPGEEIRDKMVRCWNARRA